jgi:regulator of protease activity HflC (stomatin/prohibitin superfamily)
MSSDLNDPGSTWEEPSHANWTQSPDLNPSQHEDDGYPIHAQKGTHTYESGAHNMLDTSFSPEQGELPGNQEMNEEENDTVEDFDSTTKPASFLKRIWYYVTLIVFPVVFFGIACLLILPPIWRGPGPLAFWFTALVLLIIAVGQGVAVYFSGHENHMWVPGTLGGMILFVLLGVFAVVNPVLGIVLLLLIGGGCIYLARRCIHPVVEGTVHIVYVAGKYSRTLFPGFHLIWPWEEIAHQVNIEETHWDCQPQQIQLSPEEDVILRAVISYQVAPEDAYITVTRINNWEESLRNLFTTTLQTVATHFVPTDFVPWSQSLQAYQAQTSRYDDQSAHLPDEGVDDFSGGPARRDQINKWLFEQMRDGLAPLGVQIHWVRIRDIQLRPHTLSGVNAAPVMPDSAKTANNHQVEQELIRVSSVAQTNKTPLADGQGKENAGKAGEHIPADQGPTEAVAVGARSAASQPPQPRKSLTEEVMRKTYEAVQNGKVTDPESIRRWAADFEAVARDPEASQKISFDVERAAANLHKQADHYERMHRSGQA